MTEGTSACLLTVLWYITYLQNASCVHIKSCVMDSIKNVGREPTFGSYAAHTGKEVTHTDNNLCFKTENRYCLHLNLQLWGPLMPAIIIWLN